MGIFKGIFIYVIGALSGGAAVYYGLSKSFDERLELEVENAREYYERKNGKLRRDLESFINKNESKNKAKNTEETEAYFDMAKTYKPNRDTHKTNYSDISKKVDPAEKESPEDDEVGYVILTPQGFAASNPYYDKITLLYYEEDRVLMTEDYEERDISETIGNEALKRIGEYEKDVVYVRNCAYQTDYEVIRQYGSSPLGDDSD